MPADRREPGVDLAPWRRNGSRVSSSSSSNSLRTCSCVCSLSESCIAWKFLKPSARAAWLRSSTSSFRSASTTGPTSLLASQTALRRAESVDSLRTLRTSLSVISLPSTLAR